MNLEKKLQIRTSIKINKNNVVLYNTLTDNYQLTNFILVECLGEFIKGKFINWRFSENEKPITLKILQLIPYSTIQYEWEIDRQKLKIEFTLLPYQEHQTIVSIHEGEMNLNSTGLDWLAKNTVGWTYFLTCLKAYSEFGINLSKNAYDHLSNNEYNLLSKKSTIEN